MADLTTYDVLRQHFGDRQYYEGEQRELSSAEAKSLVSLGVLAERQAKAEPPLLNKAERVPTNKAAGAATEE